MKKPPAFAGGFEVAPGDHKAKIPANKARIFCFVVALTFALSNRLKGEFEKLFHLKSHLQSAFIYSTISKPIIQNLHSCNGIIIKPFFLLISFGVRRFYTS
jgi:hypothetical protein